MKTTRPARAGLPAEEVLETIIASGMRTYRMACGHSKTIPDVGTRRKWARCFICNPAKPRPAKVTKIGQRMVDRARRRELGCTCARRHHRGCPAFVAVPWSKKARAT